MKLLRYGEPGREKPGLLDDTGRIRDLSQLASDITPESLAGGLIDGLKDLDVDRLPIVPGTPRLGPCIARPGKIVCIGLNYEDHADEANLERPSEPVIFLKAPSALCGANDPIVLPRGASKVDWEVELGVVIGRSARCVGETDALTHLAGYCIVNDVSERGFQFDHNGQWTKGKSADSFCPTGPWLVTVDEVADPQALDLRLAVDGRNYQQGSTARMIFPVSAIIAYVSRFMSLHPGDLIATGTPAGVGMGQKPPVYLQPGNEIRTAIAGLGEQRQSVLSRPPA